MHIEEIPSNTVRSTENISFALHIDLVFTPVDSDVFPWVSAKISTIIITFYNFSRCKKTNFLILIRLWYSFIIWSYSIQIHRGAAGEFRKRTHIVISVYAVSGSHQKCCQYAPPTILFNILFYVVILSKWLKFTNTMKFCYFYLKRFHWILFSLYHLNMRFVNYKFLSISCKCNAIK